MPQNAIAADYVDHILPPGAIARELSRLSLHPSPAAQESVVEAAEIPQAVEQDLTGILLVLRNATGVDFLSYKQATLRRRILHRIAGLQIEHLTEYATYLREHPAEINMLYQADPDLGHQLFRDETPFSVHSVPFHRSALSGSLLPWIETGRAIVLVRRSVSSVFLPCTT